MLRPIVISFLLNGLPLGVAIAAPASPATAVPVAVTNNSPKPAATKISLPPTTTTTVVSKTMTAQQYIQQQHELRQEVKKMQQQVDQVSSAHQTIVAANQALQLANDNLSVQVKVLQSEQSAQMFLYGATTVSIGGVLGFLLGSVMARRQRRW